MVRVVGALWVALAGVGARADEPGMVLWGVMDWKTDASYPITDTDPGRPIFQDGDARIIAHQYQSPSWLTYKTSAANKAEVTRIYQSGYCINLMLYFVSCTRNPTTGAFSYPLNDQFLDDFADLIDAYKVGGGPLYIQVFPEFELWYSDKSPAEQELYRAKIRDQYAQMVQIARQRYSKAYIGLCFMGLDFVGDTSQFVTRWDPVMKISDLVYVNFMTTYPNWATQARMMVKSTKLLAENWGLPIMFPYVQLWDDQNTPIFTPGHVYSQDAQNFSNAITSWIGATMTAPSEVQGSTATDWQTNLATLRSRGVFAYSLYSSNFCNKPNTPKDPNGNTHPLPSYGVLTNLMQARAKSFLYPFSEAEYWQPVNTPVATAPYSVVSDWQCSNGKLVVLNATSASGQYFTYRVPVTRSGTYRVKVGIRKQADGGWFYLWVNGSGSPQGSERNCSLASGVGNYQEYDQGTVTFSNVTQTKWTDFKFGVSRAGNGGGYKLAIDYIKLIPQ